MGVEFTVGENNLRIIAMAFLKVNESNHCEMCWNINDTAGNGLVPKGLILQLDQIPFGSKSGKK